LSRILTGRTELKYYEAGMDLGLSTNPHESFKIFQQRIVNEYESMIDEFGLTVMDATLPIPEQQRQMRKLVKPYLKGIHRLHSSARSAAEATMQNEKQEQSVEVESFVRSKR
jgi:dTMP kinase